MKATEHTDQAKELLARSAALLPNPGRAVDPTAVAAVIVAQAQVYATLALVEMLRSSTTGNVLADILQARQ